MFTYGRIKDPSKCLAIQFGATQYFMQASKLVASRRVVLIMAALGR